MNNQTHFAKYIGKPIFNEITDQTVILKGLRENSIQFLNGEPHEQNGKYTDFKIIVADDLEVLKNDLPVDLAVVVTATTKTRPAVKVNPEMFLAQLQDLLYPPLKMTHSKMIKLKKCRKHELVITRQVIMACYFCAFEGSEHFKITQDAAGEIYGKDHATVKYSIDIINNLIDTDKFFVQEFKKVWAAVKAVNSCSRLHI